HGPRTWRARRSDHHRDHRDAVQDQFHAIGIHVYRVQSQCRIQTGTDERFRGHFAIGRGFIPAEAIMLTGYTTTVVSGRPQISQGNPDLRPERSTSFDPGAEWTSRLSRLDLTV